MAESDGYAIIAHDPLNGYWGEAAHVYDDALAFMRACHDIARSWVDDKRNWPVLVVVDEADLVLSQSDRHHWWIVKRGRHYAMKVIVITQRPALVAPTVRGQTASDAYVFNVSKSDAKLLADDCAASGLMAAPTLKQGEFLHAYWRDRKKIVDRGRVF